MSDYRDYGQAAQVVNHGSGSYSYGPYTGKTNQLVDTTRRSQVFQATHGGDDNRLPFMHRSFISFTYGGKHIEDFDLIATFGSDRLNKLASASFEDRVSAYEVLNGQRYWGTHYKPNELEFNLSTDGIDQQKLEDFRYWFRAGDAKELVLSEHPNRAILARVAEAPQLNLVPFESEVSVKINNKEYQTKTTLYKGDITLKFVMDDPYWYAIDNILGKLEESEQRYVNEWTDANGNSVSIFESQDALKILYEDGIPLGSMIQSDMLLGNKTYAKVEDRVEANIWTPNDPEDTSPDKIQSPNTADEDGYGACIAGTVGGVTYKGIISGPIIDADGNGINSLPAYGNGGVGYFYYSGTAPAPTIITFTLTPTFSDSSNNIGYIVVPRNLYVSGEKKYNTITIESTYKQELNFVTPNLYTSYNKAIKIFEQYTNDSYTWEDIRGYLRDEVRHARVREWAIKVVDDNATETAAATNTVLGDMKSAMASMFKDGDTVLPATFMFNSEDGTATGYFKYKTVSNDNIPNDPIEEDVGDMLRSNYIVITDRNKPTPEGYITAWTNMHKENSHRIYHDVEGGLSNISILYKNMYL